MDKIDIDDPSYPVEGQRYRHYKGGRYKVILLAEDAEDDSENPSLMVVYRSLNNNRTWTRPLTSWMKPLDDGSPRFVWLNPNRKIQVEFGTSIWTVGVEAKVKTQWAGQNDDGTNIWLSDPLRDRSELIRHVASESEAERLAQEWNEAIAKAGSNE